MSTDDKGEPVPGELPVVSAEPEAAAPILDTPVMPYDTAAMPPPPEMPPTDEPSIPLDDSLGEAVGAPSPAAKRRKARDARALDDDGTPLNDKRRGRTVAIVVGSIGGGLLIAALVFLGSANSDRYLITCASSKVTAEQGRSFPPWGTRPMPGPEWKPITLPPNAECKPRETDDEGQLGGWYLDMLLDRVTVTLTAKSPLELAGPDAKTSALDVATSELEQALLLARSPDKRDQRKEVERMLGDIDYWHATARLRDASTTLLDAAKQFETAASKRPRHVTDASAWSSFLHRLADELHAGPNAAPPVTVPAGSEPAVAHEPAPMGSALPVESEPAGSAEVAPPPPPPAGGVLL